MIFRDKEKKKKRKKKKTRRIIKPLGINIIRNNDPLEYLPVPTFGVQVDIIFYHFFT